MSLFGHSFSVWFRGLLSTVISGSAGGALTGLAGIGIDPDHINLSSGLGKFFMLAGFSAAIMGFIALLNYLKQSPLPPPDGA